MRKNLALIWPQLYKPSEVIIGGFLLFILGDKALYWSICEYEPMDINMDL